eukprot:TRINITY_DN59124_c2_g1_i1.p1 TRINITY_DN59124_c2_g1~~TRINITY_DN59124_c2_g1_i1.p1  ORF type:complete len:583 (+),score=129.57 TRINITY_DN59124_c2_g1_i1:119-1867(+)
MALALSARMPPPATPGSKEKGGKKDEAKAAKVPEPGALARLKQLRPKEETAMVLAADPFPMKPIPSKVLSEEDYTEVLGTIIERDFYPDLPQLRARHELMKARQTGDPAAVQEALLKLAHMPRPTPASTPGATPAGTIYPGTPGPSETPRPSSSSHAAAPQQHVSAWERDDDTASVFTMPSAEDPSRTVLRLTSGKEVVVNLAKCRLDDFQRLFTSEDNASFEEVMQKDLEKKRQKQWWIEAPEQTQNTLVQKQMGILKDGEDLPNSDVMLHEFKARNDLYFKNHDQKLPHMEMPKVDFKNTRFTTSQQEELDRRLDQAFLDRAAETCGVHAAEAVLRNGKRDYGLLHKGAMEKMSGIRNITGRFQGATPGQEVHGYEFVKTPSLLPGEGGMSPLMTYGKIASTPALIEEDMQPKFNIQEQGAREIAAERLTRGVTQKQREAQQLSKVERLRALGITPPAGTPGSRAGTPAGSTSRRTPGAATSSRIVTPLSPIGQLIQRAQRMQREGGRLGISTGSGAGTPRPRSAAATPSASTPAMQSRGSRAREASLAPDSEARPHKRLRSSAQEADGPLEASITDGLL